MNKLNLLLLLFTLLANCKPDNKTRTQAQELLLSSVIKINYEGVRQALRMGADVNQLQSWGVNAFFMAVQNGDLKIIKSMLAAGANVNLPTEGGLTPLIVASENGMTEITEILLRKKANIHAKSDNGITALMAARDNKHGKIELLLLKAGAKE